jgi:DNA gyrase subunit A
VVNLIQVQPGVRLAATLSVREFSEGRFVVLGTKNGIVKKTPLADFSRPRAAGIIALTIEEGDDLLGAGLSSGSDEIFMATAEGKAIRFNETDVRPMGRGARGVIGIRLAQGDSVVGMGVLSGKPDILTVTRNGYGKRSPVGDYRLQQRGGSGIINIRTTERNGPVVASFEVDDPDQVLMITTGGKIIRVNASGVSRIGRATQGVRMIQVESDDAVASAIPPEREEEGEGGGGAPEAAAPESAGDESESDDIEADGGPEDEA